MIFEKFYEEQEYLARKSILAKLFFSRFQNKKRHEKKIKTYFFVQNWKIMSTHDLLPTSVFIATRWVIAPPGCFANLVQCIFSVSTPCADSVGSRRKRRLTSPWICAHNTWSGCGRWARYGRCSKRESTSRASSGNTTETGFSCGSSKLKTNWTLKIWS